MQLHPRLSDDVKEMILPDMSYLGRLAAIAGFGTCVLIFHILTYITDMHVRMQ